MAQNGDDGYQYKRCEEGRMTILFEKKKKKKEKKKKKKTNARKITGIQINNSHFQA